MAEALLDKLSEEFKSTNTTPLSEESFAWFESKRQELKPQFELNKEDANIPHDLKSDGAIRDEILTDSKRRSRVFFRGRFYMFFYYPKGINNLPYWDRFPLIFLLKVNKNKSILGLNFHYLDYHSRIQFLENSMKWANNRPLQENSRLLVPYEILKTTRKYRTYKAMIKRYDPKHIRSQIIKIPGDEWEMALHLPVERFRKRAKERVWLDSKRISRRLK